MNTTNKSPDSEKQEVFAFLFRQAYINGACKVSKFDMLPEQYRAECGEYVNETVKTLVDYLSKEG